MSGVVKSAGRGAVPFNISVGGTRGHACPSHVIQQPERGAAELEFPTDLAQQIEDALQEGYNVVTPLVNYRMSIRGVFEGPLDGFDESRHRLLPRLLPGKRLRKALRDVPVAKVRSEKPRPQPLMYLDIATGVSDDIVTPGGVGQVAGDRLRFDPADPDEGIFFVSGENGTTRVETMVKNSQPS